ncbi:MAG: endonuclease/exonuclease/phosphatase family protein [Pseudomonadota bacterium]
MTRRVLALVVLLVSMVAASAEPVTLRFATFNAALSDNEAGAILARLQGGRDRQAKLVAETIQRVRPDILLLQEIDRDPEGLALRVFMDQYLAVSQNGAAPLAYTDIVFPPSNTGVATGLDLNGDGRRDGPADARGFGHHKGQYAFALLSTVPLGTPRTFASLLWRDMPGNRLPKGHYGAAAEAVLPVSSKTHLVVPLDLSPAAGPPVYVIAAHPTPPVFDDDEIDWNGRRNADEIRLIADLLDPERGAYLVDDVGGKGPLPASVGAVVMGDLNADPHRGESLKGAMDPLLANPLIVDAKPRSHRGTATATFNDGMRVDYVLVRPVPESAGTGGRFVVNGEAGVIWPREDGPLAHLNDASDHRLVFVDTVWQPAGRQ